MDFGTSGCRVSLIDERGVQKFETSVKYTDTREANNKTSSSSSMTAIWEDASARECARRRIAEEIHIANAMVENVNERVMSIVYTHCLRVYSRPVAPLRATLFDFRSDNA